MLRAVLQKVQETPGVTITSLSGMTVDTNKKLITTGPINLTPAVIASSRLGFKEIRVYCNLIEVNGKKIIDPELPIDVVSDGALNESDDKTPVSDSAD